MRTPYSATITAIRRTDAAQRRLGHAFAWLVLAVAVAQFSVVALRHLLDTGFVWQQINIRYLNGAFCLMGLGYALLNDAHVRVDIWYRQASMRRKAVVDLLGTVLFILPLCVVIVWVSRAYVLSSWAILEGAQEGGGVPLVFMYKSLLWAAPALLFLQGLSTAAKAWLFLKGAFVSYPPVFGTRLSSTHHHD